MAALSRGLYAHPTILKAEKALGTSLSLVVIVLWLLTVHGSLTNVGTASVQRVYVESRHTVGWGGEFNKTPDGGSVSI